MSGLVPHRRSGGPPAPGSGADSQVPGSATAAAPSTARAATGRNLAALAVKAWRVRGHGADLVPREGPVVLVANHAGVLDGVLVAARCPRPVHVLVSADLAVPPFTHLLATTGQIPMSSAYPDRVSLRAASAVLGGGGVVALFPEGEAGAGDVRHAHHGAAYLALTCGAPVVPVAVLGSRPRGARRDALPRLRSAVDVVFGAPVLLRPEGDPRRRAVLTGAGERVRQLLADHVGAAMAATGQTLPGPPPLPDTPRRSHT
ncbi:MAG: 1-acyl-sn-glycerol-3-phosphate acyltransferase [Frankiales bacterium]|nr:1-acyl-sn-glycerol-3-phosphate acyltransferase [Frankiales bacterium]